MANSEIKPILQLYLIRHAQSRGNVKGFITENNSLMEREDPVLTDKGMQQAQRLSEYLSAVPFDAVYASCMFRTVLTANEVLKHQQNARTLYMHPLFTEFNISPDYKGAGEQALRAVCPNARLCPDVEKQQSLIAGSSLDDEQTVLARAQQALSYLTSRYHNGELVAVISHAGFITNMLFSVLGFDTKCPPCDFSLNNTGITLLRFYAPGQNPFGDIVVEYVNATPHLI